MKGEGGGATACTRMRCGKIRIGILLGRMKKCKRQLNILLMRLCRVRCRRFSPANRSPFYARARARMCRIIE